jgi:hypothetical protein
MGRARGGFSQNFLRAPTPGFELLGTGGVETQEPSQLWGTTSGDANPFRPGEFDLPGHFLNGLGGGELQAGVPILRAYGEFYECRAHIGADNGSRRGSGIGFLHQ